MSIKAQILKNNGCRYATATESALDYYAAKIPFRDRKKKFKLVLLVLALLVSNTARGLASRLAGSLALAASAVLCAVAKISGLDSLNVFHSTPP